MVFILLLVFVFGMVLAGSHFGSAPDGGIVTNANSRAMAYAQNMATWHQAALLAAKLDVVKNDSKCPSTNTSTRCAIILNDVFWDYVNRKPKNDPLVGVLKQFWPDYQPMVSMASPEYLNWGGWQSYLVRNTNLTGNVAGRDQAFVMTVFRGFGGLCKNDGSGGGGLPTQNNLCKTETLSSERGGVDNFQLATALAKVVDDRLGVGTLKCTGSGGGPYGNCRIYRTAAFVTTNSNGTHDTKIDNPMQFDLFPFYGLTNQTPPPPIPNFPKLMNPSNLYTIFDGLPAIITVVSNTGLTDAGGGNGSGNGLTCPKDDTHTWGFMGSCGVKLSFANPPLIGYSASLVTNQIPPGKPGWTVGTPTVASCVAPGVWQYADGTCISPPCTTQTLSWGSNCKGSFVGVAAGNPQTAINTMAGYAGTGSTTCNNGGVWGPVSGTCNATCPAGNTVQWSNSGLGGSCRGQTVAGEYSKPSSDIQNVTMGFTGKLSPTCQSNGTWAYSNFSCTALTCPGSYTVSWSAGGNSCSGATSAATGNIGNTQSVNNTLVGMTGTATATCKDVGGVGVWQATGTCTPGGGGGGGGGRVIFLTRSDTSPFKVPSDWNNSSNKIMIIGSGGSGSFLHGGGGGAFAQISNLTLVPNSNVAFSISAKNSEADSWFRNSFTVLAKGGKNATDAVAGLGGNGLSSVGDIKYSGGNGGAGRPDGSGGGGGGGGAGPNGKGGNGANGTSSVNCIGSGGGGGGNGGQNASGANGGLTGGFGGDGANNIFAALGFCKTTQAPGKNGSEFTATMGPNAGRIAGPGGGGAGHNRDGRDREAGSGGIYGGGGGGGGLVGDPNTTGQGGDGLIIITY